MLYIVFNSTRLRRSWHLARLVIPTDPGQALAFARWTDQAADLVLADGRFVLAEHLSHAAYEARRWAAVAK